ncbi:MAG: glycosyltransferase [Deltaproteobacteria bacterium]|nr:glycosyltransferase [Deltaproteobacteria bacterium]
MTTFVCIALFLVMLFQVGLLTTWLEVHRELPKLGPRTRPGVPDNAPLVSVVIPARDEEKTIETCVAGVLAQDWPNLEVIVVDDRSSDRTPEILARLATQDPRLTVIRGEECPKTWMGKNYALHQGFTCSRGEWILFLDADTQVAPQVVTQTVREAEHTDTGLLTLIPGNVFRCFWDRVVNTLIFQLAAFQQFDKIHDPTSTRANANGPYMLFRRDCYDAIGGHAAIPYEVVEDLVLARNVKEKGFRIRWALAPELMKLELYESLRDLKRGWGKILQRAMEIDRREIVMNLLGPLFLLVFFVLPFPALLASTGWLLTAATPASVFAFVCALAACSAAATSQRFVGVVLRLDEIHPWLFWLGALVLAELQWESVVRLFLKKEMYWKGRLYHES